jgi:outer membrane cobalamin receptor
MKARQTLILSLLIGISATAFALTEPADTTVYNLDNVVVTGTKYKSDIRHLPMTISVVEQEKLNENYKQNVLPTLNQYVPGLFVNSRGILGYGVGAGSTGAIKVRGIGSMANLLVLIDGLPQYAGLYGHPIADSYQTIMADKVEVLRGPASTIYGSNAMGGVVNIVTRQMITNGCRTDINMQAGSYGTFEAAAVNRFRSGKFSSVAGANYGRTDGHRTNSGFEQTSGFMKLGFDFNPNWTLTGDVNITYFESSNPGAANKPLIDNDMMITRGMASMSLTNEYAKTGGALRLFYNWGHHHINDGYNLGSEPKTAYYLHNDRMGGFSIYQSASFFKGNRLTVGMDYFNFGGHAWNRMMSDGTEKDIIDKTVNEAAGYLDIRQSITDWITIDAGLRLNHHSVSGNEWVPQFGTTLQLPHNALVKAMVSKGFRNATIRELYMYPPANSDLKPERLMNYELSYKQSLLDGQLDYGINVFYLKAQDLISVNMIDGRPRNVNTGATEHCGVEAEANLRINSHLALNGNYCFLHMSNPQLSAPEHKAFVGANYRYGRFAANAGLQYVAGLYTAVGKDEKKENFLLLNATAKYRFYRGMHVFVKGENLFAQSYETVLGFPMPHATVMAGINCSF